MLLTFVIGELKVVVHGGHKIINDETPDDRRQVTFTPHLPLEDLNVVICREISNNMRNKMLRNKD